MVVFDIDGTLTTMKPTDFLEYGCMNWSRFEQALLDAKLDRTIPFWIDQLHRNDYSVILVSQRPIVLKHKTEFWLKFHQIPFNHLIMNVDHDISISDFNFKKNLFSLKHFPKDRIIAFFDDNPEVIDMIKEMKINAILHEPLRF